MIKNMAEFNKYQVIKKAISYELANFVFNYFLLKRDAVKFMYENNITYDNGMLGTWEDGQIPNTYSHYADHVMETLLMKVLPILPRPQHTIVIGNIIIIHKFNCVSLQQKIVKDKVSQLIGDGFFNNLIFIKHNLNHQTFLHKIKRY